MTQILHKSVALNHGTGLRRTHIGAWRVDDDCWGFRVWAPKRQRVRVAFLSTEKTRQVAEVVPLDAEADGYFYGLADSARVGTLYGYLLDDDERLYPDPASRFQPEGPHGPSQLVDATSFEWTDKNWPGVELVGQVIYEMHVGTFTHEGTWSAAARQLEELASLGVTLIEMMPVADFPGRFGWGYDGVNLFAPTRLYGTPDDLRRFNAQAHAAGIGVILDVVYNHFGPDGNFLPAFADHYYSDRHATDWGPAINFDGEGCQAVREYVLANAAYWIDEFHFDGLRLDATQDIHDDSTPHIISELSQQVREAAGERQVLLVAENEPQHTQLVRPVHEGGCGLDALWNDDFHHSAMVALSGRNEAYYSDYLGSPQEFISAAKYGYLYHGQWYGWQKQRRGTPTRGLPPATFVNFIQNHDQVANSGRGQRGHQLASPGVYKAITAVLLLMPGTPMLFQGQEFAASSPFFYFADHPDELAKKVSEGRREFMAQFRSIAQPEIQAMLPDPADPATFMRSKLDFAERTQHAPFYALHRDLLQLRRDDPTFRSQRPLAIDGAVLGDEAFLLRWFGEDPSGQQDRLAVVNFGRDLHLRPSPEPLLAPPADSWWELLWSTEAPSYGGCGTAPLETEDNWRIPGHAAVILRPITSEAFREQQHGNGHSPDVES
ncbi:MAG: malto-oligosyltrehalose trehalohydrolase [Planctomycetales bacterium]|nr:malto-oligosyltrehalose trehalohydrolase [Planctomycetales bacterium]